MSEASITFADQPDGSINVDLIVCGNGDTPAVNIAKRLWESLRKAREKTIVDNPPPEPSPEQPVA